MKSFFNAKTVISFLLLTAAILILLIQSTWAKVLFFVVLGVCAGATVLGCMRNRLPTRTIIFTCIIMLLYVLSFVFTVVSENISTHMYGHIMIKILFIVVGIYTYIESKNIGMNEDGNSVPRNFTAIENIEYNGRELSIFQYGNILILPEKNVDLFVDNDLVDVLSKATDVPVHKMVIVQEMQSKREKRWYIFNLDSELPYLKKRVSQRYIRSLDPEYASIIIKELF